jgi:hypothetical protein
MRRRRLGSRRLDEAKRLAKLSSEHLPVSRAVAEVRSFLRARLFETDAASALLGSFDLEGGGHRFLAGECVFDFAIE